jgi:hypothetical protein
MSLAPEDFPTPRPVFRQSCNNLEAWRHGNDLSAPIVTSQRYSTALNQARIEQPAWLPPVLYLIKL